MYIWEKMLVNTLVFSVCMIPHVSSSNGDRSSYYQKCLRTCKADNCVKSDKKSEDSLLFKDHVVQKLGPKLLRWTCLDECRYDCMWDTVAWFEDQNVPTPKFHGKWPFYHLFGIQEPASAFFSILNLLAHVNMCYKLNQKLMERGTPFKVCWRLFAVVCINAWVWSTIFHTRDTPFTEFMDYICALSMVLAFYGTVVIRLLYELWHPYPALVALLPTILYCGNHARALWGGHLDYDINMALNIGLGCVTGILWLAWSVWQYRRDRVEGTYVWRIVAFTLTAAALLVLEVFDFPPLWGVLDAHALWHLTTAPLPYLYYKFLIDDINFILASQKKYKAI